MSYMSCPWQANMGWSSRQTHFQISPDYFKNGTDTELRNYDVFYHRSDHLYTERGIQRFAESLSLMFHMLLTQDMTWRTVYCAAYYVL